MSWFRRAAVALCLVAMPSAVSFAQSASLGPPVGQVSIHQLSVAFIGSAAVGGGALRYRGRTYRFKAAGLGVGGVGASRLDAGGNIYGLQQLSDFEGAYLQARSALPSAMSAKASCGCGMRMASSCGCGPSAGVSP